MYGSRCSDKQALLELRLRQKCHGQASLVMFPRWVSKSPVETCRESELQGDKLTEEVGAACVTLHE
jgi:hypothetical protein